MMTGTDILNNMDPDTENNLCVSTFFLKFIDLLRERERVCERACTSTVAGEGRDKGKRENPKQALHY